MTQVPKITLLDGKKMPMLGLGTYSRKADPGQTRQAVEFAINVGYRHIDSASIYNNEIEVGEAVQKKINEGLVRREDLFITTKLWQNCHGRENVVPTLKESLKKLQLDYTDLYLIHWPMSTTDSGEDLGIDNADTWRGMEDALKLGLTKSIGVSNFNADQLEHLMKTAVNKPVCNQFEISATMSQHQLVDFCKKHSITPVAYTPLGLLSDARPEFFDKAVIKTDPKLQALAEKHGKTKAQVLLRYLIQREIPALPKSFTKSRIEENINIFDFKLSDQDMEVVESLNIDHRCVPSTKWSNLKNYPF